MVWNNISCNFDNDETVNFGPRQETGSALYQVDTLATISSDEEVKRNPRTYGTASGEYVAVACDGQVSIFSDNCHKYLRTLDFDSPVDVLAFTNDMLFLVIGESNGYVHIMNISLLKVFMSKPLLSDEDLIAKNAFTDIFFTPVDDGGSCDLLILAKSGQLFQLSGILSEQLDDALDAQDIKTLVTLQSKMSITAIDTSAHHSKMSNCFSWAENIIATRGSGDSVLTIWSKIEKSFQTTSSKSAVSEDCAVKKCILSSDGFHIFVLDTDGYLSLCDSVMMCVVEYWTNVQYKDFILLEEGQNISSFRDLNLIGLTEEHDNGCLLEVRELHNFQLIYSLHLSSYTVLLNSPCDQESVFVLEGVYDENQNVISQLRIRSITEAHPETRLFRLLHKNKFDEAVEFATLFELDLELVYKAKASYLLNKLSPWNQISVEGAEECSRLLRECLEVIQDENCIFEYCISAALPSFEATFDLLMYAKTRLFDAKAIAAADKETLMERLLESLNRLWTFHVAFGSDAFTGQVWDSFLNVNLLKCIHRQLLNGNIFTALTIWKRHQGEFEGYLNPALIEELLELMNNDVATSEIQGWLEEDLVPLVVCKWPDALPIVADFIDRKTREMETQDQEKWPKDGIMFAECFNRGCAIASEKGAVWEPVYLSTQIKKASHPAIANLHQLINDLRKILELEEKYECKLTLLQYSKETTESLAYRMLECVGRPANIKPTVDRIIQPYATEYKLNLSKLLYNAVLDGMSIGKRWVPLISPVIECIDNLEYQCMAILAVMRAAIVPWEPYVDHLVKLGLSLTHPRVKEIKEQCQLAELKLLLTKYQVSADEALFLSSAEVLVYYILKQDMASAVDDALEVVKVCSYLSPIMVYMLRLHFLIKNNRLSECMDLFKLLSSMDAIQCGSRIAIQTQELLKIPFNSDREEERLKRIYYTTAAENILSHILLFLQPESLQFYEFEMLLSAFHNLLPLQMEFNEFLSIEDYQILSTREQILQRHVVIFTQDKERPSSVHNFKCVEKNVKQSQQRSFCKIFRLADLLKISRDWLLGRLAIEAAKSGNIKKTTELCSDLQEKSVTGSIDTSEALHRVAHILIKLIAEFDKEIPEEIVNSLPQVIFDMVKHASTYCQSGLLPDCLQLFKNAYLMLRLSKLCETGDFNSIGQDSQCMEEGYSLNPYNSWVYAKHFIEDGLMLEGETVLSMVSKYSMATLPSVDKADNKKYPYCQNRMQGSKMEATQNQEEENKVEGVIDDFLIKNLQEVSMELVRYVKQMSHTQFSMEVMMDAVGAAHLYVIVQDMGHSLSEDIEKKLNLMQKNFVAMNRFGLNVVNDILKTLLPKIFRHHFVDHDMALMYLFCLPSEVVHGKLLDKVINSCGHNYKRIEWITLVAYDYAHLNNDIAAYPSLEILLKETSWGHRLAKMKVEFKDAFRSSKEDKQKLLPMLAKNPYFTPTLINDFCRDFNLPSYEALLIYLENVLLPAQSERLDIKDTDEIQFQRNVNQVIVFLHENHPRKLKDKLMEILTKLDPYDYKKIRFVLSEFLSLYNDCMLEKGVDLLALLYTYKRVEPPTEYEIMYCKDNKEDQQMFGVHNLSPESTERLPFHPLIWGKPWKIITPELQEDNFDQWLPTAKLLKLSEDHLYMAVIQNMVKNHIENLKEQGRFFKQDKAKCDWLAENVNHSMFEQIRRFIICMESCELAVACITWVVQELPMGAEKVAAFKECVILTEHWSKNTDDEENSKAVHSFTKFSQIYKKIHVEQILYSEKLNELDLLALCANPLKLINKLYEHESIPQRISQGLSGSYPDIHTAAERVCMLYEIDLPALHVAMIDKWLTVNNSSDADFSMTFNFNLNLDETTVDMLNEDEMNLKRVMYLLQFRDFLTKGLSYLLICGMKREDKKRVERLRALRVLYAMANDSDILGHSKSSIKEEIKMMSHLVELEKLHVLHSVESFMECNKEALVFSVWKNHSHEQRAVRVVTHMCLEFKIFDVQLWSGLIKQMMTFSMTEFLELTLIQIASMSELRLVTHLKRAWTYIILNPFSSAIPPLSNEQLKRCVNSLSLLHRCPVLHDIDVNVIYQHFLKADMKPCALYCLMLIPSQENRSKLIKEFIVTHGAVKFLEEFDHFSDKGIRSGVMEQVIGVFYDYIDEAGLYKSIMRSSLHIQPFTDHLLNKNNINGLLKFAVTENKLDNARGVVQIYHKQYPLCESAEFCKQDGAADPLKAYLASHGLLDEVMEHFTSDDESEDSPVER